MSDYIEQDNDLDLVDGFDGMSDAEVEDFIEGLGRYPRGRRARMVRKRTSPRRRVIPTSNLTAKAEFEKRFSRLPKDIQADLKTGKKQLVDSNYYSIVDFSSSKYKELMANADTKTVGLANLNGRKLDANVYFLLVGIQLEVATFSAQPYDASFAVPPAVFLNGEFKMEVGNKIIVPSVSCEVFNTANETVKKGYWKLDNPKFIPPQTEIIPELSIPAAAAATTAVKLTLWGVQVEKN